MSAHQFKHGLDFKTQYGLPLSEIDDEINVDLSPAAAVPVPGLR